MSDFNDELSRTEFGISYMCQQCQDELFEDEDEDDSFYDQDAPEYIENEDWN